jgi:lytic murein transglycosylase
VPAFIEDPHRNAMRITSGTRTTALAALLAASFPRPAAAADSVDGCLPGLRSEAVRSGVATATFDQHIRGIVPDMTVVALLDDQPEFRTPIWDYLAALVDAQRVEDGRAMLARWQDTLASVTARYGVDAQTVVAVWGVESDYGRSFGKRPLLTSLTTLSCFGRRQGYFRGELFSALKIIERGDVSAEGLVGSWAGAFGHTQFMPSTYIRVAVDHDGDGRRDLVGNVPDALASTANFLARAGWRLGQPWGFEVRLPAGFDTSRIGRRAKRPLSEWAASGVRRADGAPLLPLAAGTVSGASPGATPGAAPGAAPGAIDAATPAAVLLPAGAGGPAFVVFGNFDAIYSYNAAESYALAIAHLSDRLRGAGGFVTPWPTDDPGLSRAERRELQTLLIQRGHAIGEVDGMLGTASRTAIKAEQQRLGMAADGRAGQRLLQALRAG